MNHNFFVAFQNFCTIKISLFFLWVSYTAQASSFLYLNIIQSASNLVHFFIDRVPLDGSFSWKLWFFSVLVIFLFYLLLKKLSELISRPWPFWFLGFYGIKSPFYDYFYKGCSVQKCIFFKISHSIMIWNLAKIKF